MTSDATSDARSSVLCARRFQITLNEPDKYQTILNWVTHHTTFKYLISCKEKAPTTEHEHIHIYVCFKNIFRFPCPNPWGAHVEICRGSNKSNIDYIKKDGNILDELGDIPCQGAKYSFDDLRNLETPNDLPVHLFKTWTYVKQFNQAMTRNMIYKPGIVVHYIWGDSGTGKTKKVFDMVGDEQFDRVKFVNNFWTGVSMDNSVKIAWYDDFRDSDMKPSEFINFIDYYCNNMNIKGSHVLNHYTTIFITSVQSPEDLYKNMTLEEPRKQWLRRLHVIHLE